MTPSPSSGETARIVFLSSTVRDLRSERTVIKRFLETRRAAAPVRCLISEGDDFPVGPDVVGAEDTYSICIRNLIESDYVVQVLNRRYGIPNVRAGRRKISITHLEYRTAREQRIPVFSFVNARTLRARRAFRKGEHQRYVPTDQTRLFELIDEVEQAASGPGRKRWCFPFETTDNILSSLASNLLNFDDSTFVGDITIPDGTTVRVGKRFKKVCEIRNAGMVPWRGRFLEEQNTGVAGLVPEQHRIAIPFTPAGRPVRLSVWFTAPGNPGSFESNWKMVHKHGRAFFPHFKGIWVAVRVVERHVPPNRSLQRPNVRRQHVPSPELI